MTTRIAVALGFVLALFPFFLTTNVSEGQAEHPFNIPFDTPLCRISSGLGYITDFTTGFGDTACWSITQNHLYRRGIAASSYFLHPIVAQFVLDSTRIQTKATLQIQLIQVTSFTMLPLSGHTFITNEFNSSSMDASRTLQV
jgi:hypothetical protein